MERGGGADPKGERARRRWRETGVCPGKVSNVTRLVSLTHFETVSGLSHFDETLYVSRSKRFRGSEASPSINTQGHTHEEITHAPTLTAPAPASTPTLRRIFALKSHVISD